MDRIVGSFILLMVGCVTYAQIGLRLRDETGRQVKQVVVGYPFMVEVTLDGEHGNARNPTLDGLHQFLPAGRQTKIQTVNGVTSASYLYTLTAKKSGTYDVGPASITFNGATVSSKPMKIVVVDEDHSSRDYQKVDSVIMRLITNKTHVVVGESIQCSLQLLYSDDSIAIQDIQKPEWRGFTVKEPSEPIKRTEEIDGIIYQLVEWVWQLYPEKAGRVIIPAVMVNFREPVEEYENTFARFSFFFNQRYKNKRVYSNPLTVDIDPLPAYEGIVQGVGQFSQFYTSLKPAVAKQGEGLVLSVCLMRTFDSHVMQNVQVTGVPEGLRAYPSREYAVNQPDGSVLECVEYVMQGVKPGEWEIPVQTFTYFDVKQHEYRTIQTQPILATIFPAPVLGRSGDDIQKDSAVLPDIPDMQASIKGNDEHDIRPLNVRDVWYHRAECMISWWLFMILVTIPLFWCLAMWVLKKWTDYSVHQTSFKNKKNAFLNARKAIRLVESGELKISLYSIFVQLFVARGIVRGADHVHEMVTQELAHAGMQSADLHAWNHFFAVLAERMFFKCEERDDCSGIYKQAYEWITVLEKLL